jgi:GH15 family glucan-1,4-alpha-glucosidase
VFKLLEKSYAILDKLRMPHGLYIASLGSHYHHVWIRDSFYMSLPYLDKECDTYERAYHTMLDIFLKYEWKIDIHTKQKPNLPYEYIHPRYSMYDLEEIDQEWGNCQHDAIGAFLWGVGAGEKAGKKIIRNEKDRQLIQKLVWYLETCQYWMDSDNGVWEEWRELHSSSIGACVSGLTAVRDIVFVPRELILKGWQSLGTLFKHESASRPVDLAQLTLIYPFNIYIGEDAKTIINEVERVLLRNRGVIRYQGDSYYSTIETEGRHHPFAHYYGTEMEWCFGISWLGLAHLELGNTEKAKKYLEWSRSLALEDGSIPEGYLANSNTPNPNTPLGWSSAMHILLEEKMLNIIN